MVLLGNHLVGRRPLGAQLLVEPDQGRHDRRSLVTKPLDELHGERAAQRDVIQRSQNIVRVLSRPTAQAQQAVRQLVGLARACRERTISCDSRRRFSTRATRRWMATAQSSPMVSGWTRW